MQHFLSVLQPYAKILIEKIMRWYFVGYISNDSGSPKRGQAFDVPQFTRGDFVACMRHIWELACA
jgi:hypothetical protein